MIVLVITIIILLILAGITITSLTSENGLFGRTKEAKEKTENAQTLEGYLTEMDKVLGSSTTTEDGNSGDSTGDSSTDQVTISKSEYEQLKSKVDSIDNSLSYSTTETKTESTWIDGKPIYKIVLTGTTPETITDTVSNHARLNNITSLNIDSVVDFNYLVH